MKTELRIARHKSGSGETVVEIWHDGRFLGAIYGDEEPGVHIISKHPARVKPVQPWMTKILLDPIQRIP